MIKNNDKVIKMAEPITDEQIDIVNGQRYFDKKDLELVVSQVGGTAAAGLASLVHNNYDIVEAIMELCDANGEALPGKTVRLAELLRDVDLGFLPDQTVNTRAVPTVDEDKFNETVELRRLPTALKSEVDEMMKLMKLMKL